MTTQNELVNKLIASIDLKYITIIGIENCKKYNFIPINLKDKHLFIAINSDTDKTFVANYMHEIIKYEIKYVIIPNSDFTKILDYLLSNYTNYVYNANNETKNIENKKLTFLITIIACLLLCWIYKGFFPFNINECKFLHYWVYDGFHLAFNISNYEYDGKKYYCLTSNNEQILQINKTIQKYNDEIKDIDNKIWKLQASKYNINEYDYEKVQSLYDSAHVLKDNYYIQKGNKEKELIKTKLDSNKLIDEQIKLLMQHKNFTNVIINNEKQRMVVKYCTKQ